MFIFFQLTTNLQQPSEVQEASVLITLLLVGAAIILANVIYATVTEIVGGKTLAVLGMQASGKTQFYKTLQNLEYTGYEATSVNEYDGFDIKLADRTIHIKKGKDIGGTEAYIKQYYEKMISENEIVVFVFDVYAYLNDRAYLRNANARFDFVNQHRNEKSVVILGSHLDKIPKKERKTVIGKVQQMNKDKAYASLFSVNFFVADIRNKDAVQEIVEKIFTGK